jgi:hypothetical protein
VKSNGSCQIKKCACVSSPLGPVAKVTDVLQP